MSLDHLSSDHLVMLAMAIDPDVIAEREYTTQGMAGPVATSLAELGVDFTVRRGTAGLIIPMYGPTGALVSAQFRRDELPTATGQRPLRYLSASGMPGRLDVHPRNTARVRDVDVRLWITEGVKKADALTTRGECVIALAGVFNWRERLGTLGDWEDVPLRDREVIVCFDSDVSDNRQVMQAMGRLGRWLQSRGARVLYVVTPVVEGLDKTGADDYLSRGGDVDGLLAVATRDNPGPTPDGQFADAFLVDAMTDAIMHGTYVWCSGLGWLNWNGKRWTGCSDEHVIEEVRSWAMAQFAEALRGGGGAARTQTELINSWRGVLGSARLKAIVSLARGVMEKRAEDFDAHPLMVNTPAGVVDLETGELAKHDPELYLTKMTRGSYKPGCVHEDWTTALEAVPEGILPWLQCRFGQAITGRPTPDGVLLVFQGSGENGKSAITTDGPIVALGDYAGMASPKLLSASKGNEHSTEMADLRGQRLLIAEELTEGKGLNVLMIKRIMDVGTIKARYIRQDNIEFPASHSLFLTTNYVPVISETDHGTWRRLALVRFPFQFRKPGEPLERETDRRGDPGLKQRIRDGYGGQHDAIVTWVIQGAMAYHKDVSAFYVPDSVAADTMGWRATADRILGFWQECLIASRDACIPAQDLLSGFNRWLDGNGHNHWSKETFGPRFAQHGETTRHGVSSQKERSPNGVSAVNPWGERSGADLGRVWVWRGVKWDHGSDHVNDQAGPRGPSPSAIPRDSSQRESLPNSLDHLDRGTVVREPDHGASQDLVSQGVAVFDLETASVDDLYRYPSREYIRIMGWDLPDSPEVRITSGGDQSLTTTFALMNEHTLAGHNITGFDLQALARVGLDLTKLRGRIVDTMVRERLIDPPLSGKDGSPKMPRGYYGLNASCERRGLPSKTDELPRLAKLHGGYDQIPTDDPDYRSYLTGDVVANRALLAAQGPLDAYALREMDLALITAQMSVNGFRVDVPELEKILAAQAIRRQDQTDELVALIDLPLGKWKTFKTKPDEWEPFKSPLASNPGKEALLKAFLEFGLPETFVPRTTKGELSTSQDAMKAIADRVRGHARFTKLSRLCELVSAVVGERTVFQSADEGRVLDPDGVWRYHPKISASQASGRWSVSLLTVFGKRGGKHVERRIFLPEDGHAIITVDLDQIDNRSVAALSGDPAYMDVFLAGLDIHREVAKAVFGNADMREEAKAIGHGWNYGEGIDTMVKNGADRALAVQFDREMRRKYPRLVAWQEEMREEARSGALLNNGHGRLLRADPQFAFTQGSALPAQSCTRDLVGEGLIKLPTEFWPNYRAIVHDELVLSVPVKDAEEIGREVVKAYTFDFKGVPITAGCSRPGKNWSEVYEK